MHPEVTGMVNVRILDLQKQQDDKLLKSGFNALFIIAGVTGIFVLFTWLLANFRNTYYIFI